MTETEEFNADLEALILLCNSQALEYISEKQFPEALALLRKAESYFDHPVVRTAEGPIKSHLLGVTLANLGCYYKEAGKLKVALHYLTQGLQHLQSAGLSAKETARAQITLSAIHSFLHQHSTALQYVQSALDLLLHTEQSDHLVTELLTAYNNVASELEQLGRLQDSVEAFRRGLAFAEQTAPDHPLESVLRKGWETVKRRLEVWTEKSLSRRERRETRKVPTHFATVRTSPQMRIGTSKTGPRLPLLAKPKNASTGRTGRGMETIDSAFTLRACET